MPAGPSRVSPGKAIGWSIAFLVLTFLTAGLLGLGAGVLVTGSTPAAAEWLTSLGPDSMLLQAVVTLASTALFTWLIGFRRLGLTRHDLRYATGRPARMGWGMGLLAGGIAAGAALLISVIAGQAGWVSDAGTFGDYLLQSIKTVAVLAPAALAEEVLFRGVPLVLLAAAFGRGSGVVAISVLFALAHISNPNATQLALGNIALAGIFLGLAFYAPGGIWTAFGAHLGWNSVLACLDTPVSGVPFDIPMLDYNAGTPAWLTGGTFGPEGGLAATLALTAAILITARWTRKPA
ncbi:MAG TPA: CPBP family intramembrane glutamic endopeptidase [Gemmatimonadales bacterium]|nr:CPBP family intramembrane glutamic endopeptidase [Gemmatimonadales bacterium]